VPSNLKGIDTLKVPSIEIYTGATTPANAGEGAIWYDPNDSSVGGGYSGVIIKPSTSQTLPNAANTTINFGTEVHDIGGYYTSGQYVVFPTNGYYAARVFLEFSPQMGANGQPWYLYFVGAGTGWSTAEQEASQYLNNLAYASAHYGPTYRGAGSTLGVAIYHSSGNVPSVNATNSLLHVWKVGN
jgi:hypothetical protein